MGKINVNNDDSDKDEGENERISIDWDSFEKGLRDEKFKAKHLQIIDKSELESYGI